MIKFTYEYYKTKEEIIKFIQEDEGHCTQQTVYSTFHDAITQINFTKLIIRSNIII
jgi:hypothetical protein